MGIEQAHINWQELFVRFALAFFCLGFWHSGWNLFSFPLLTIAWLMDGGLHRLNQMVKEPFIQAILLLCTLLLLGLLWSEPPEDGRMKWLKYFILLFFIPLYSLLNKERLPWAIGALLTGYSSVLAPARLKMTMRLMLRGWSRKDRRITAVWILPGVSGLLRVVLAFFISVRKLEVRKWG